LAGLATTAAGADWFAPDNWSRPDTAIATPNAVPVIDDSGPLTLSVESAVALALANNPSLISQQQAPIIAGTFAAVERAVFDPTLFADVQQSSEETQASAGVRKLLPTGTELELVLAQDMDDGDSLGSSDTSVGLTITQAL